MKLIFIAALSILLTGFSKNEMAHPFHVSITELEIKQDTLQISLRIFTDDLEEALKGMSNEKVFLNDPSQPRRNFVLIRDYLFKNFAFANAAKSDQIEWLGHELEDDVCWIYGQVAVSPEQRILFVRNSVITEVFDNQQNIIHLKTSEGIDTELATKSNPEVRFARP